MADDGLSTIRTLLTRYGLEEMIPWAKSMIVDGKTPAEIELEMYEQAAFKRRFAGLFKRTDKGLTAMSPAEYISYEQQAFQLARAAGFPTGMIDRDTVANLIGNDVSAVELQNRIQLAQNAAFQAPPEVRSELNRLYGVDMGMLAAYYLDDERALPLLQQQFTAAQIAGSARRQSYGALTSAEAEQLSQRIGAEEADQRFGELQQMTELFKELPGSKDGSVDRETQLGLVGGDANAENTIRRRQRSRVATFEGGGGFATNEQGHSGLRTAST